MNGLGAIPEAFGGPMVNYPTSRKGKQYTSEIERLVFVYNQMDPRAKKTITYGSIGREGKPSRRRHPSGLLLGYFALLLIFRLFTSDFATLATVSALLTSIYALFFAFWLAAFVFRHDEVVTCIHNSGYAHALISSGRCRHAKHRRAHQRGQ